MALKQLKEKEEIRAAYSGKKISAQYTEERFTTSMGAILHQHQLAFLNQVLAQHGIQSIVEIAPGPARLTAEAKLRGGQTGIMIEINRNMLERARNRLETIRNRPYWSMIQGDAFHLPLQGSFDFCYTFRLIRHFTVEDRRAIYQEIRRILKPGGLLLFDAVNQEVSAPLRQMEGPETYPIYDVLFRREELVAELHENGFDIATWEPVYPSFWLQRRLQIYLAPRLPKLAHQLIHWLEQAPGYAPLEWMVLCKKV